VALTAVVDFDDAFLARIDALARALRARGWRMAAAESCTGGLVAASCTALAGSSDWFEAGWVTYSNEAKTASLGVRVQTLAAHGAVSAEVVEEMARGALARSGAQLAVAVSGIAGPGGGSVAKPVGLVWFGCARAGQPTVTARHVFPGDRTDVRRATVAEALAMLAARL